jgi:pyridoxal phosphate enzyme (YggS family)
MVADAARTSGRQPEDVTVVAVTKTVDRDAIEEAYALGLRHIGENRVQDARRKLTDLRPLPDGTVLHLIGQLQSNKARPAVALFDIIESVDRISLIDVLEKEAERRGEPVSVLLQVNIAREPQKAGCVPDSASDLMDRLVRSPWLRPRGLMTIAPLVAEAEETRPVFSGLRRLRDALQRDFPTVDLDTLSMGMSDDFPVAIEEGATSVRIGRAIFGHLA